MCGIAGFTFDDQILIRRMCDSIRQRGPDDEGYYVDSNISLGNRRLSIIDLVSGKQPIYNEDKSIIIVYNGMIYNFHQLKKILEDLRHQFYTLTDTEVIVHSYEEWGEACFKMFDGMFAIAIWDSSKNKLILSRDPCGIKPLYYTIIGKDLFFASEIKAILQYEEFERKVDLEALHYYINLRFLPKDKTLFQGVNCLLPGHYLIYDKENLLIEKYWDVDPSPQDQSESYVVSKLEAILTTSVDRHLISDVPVGVYLSGGLDSSSIVALASKSIDTPLKTFTMGFGEHTDEMDDASFVADQFNTEHNELVINSNLLKEYPKMIWHADMPKRNLYPYYIAKEVGKHVKVVLGGLGGDELFGGYEWKYGYAQDIEEERKRIPNPLAHEMKSVGLKLINYLSEYGALHEIEHIYHLKRIANLGSNVDLYLMVMSLDEVFQEKYLHRIYGSKMIKNKFPEIKELFKPFFDNNLSFIDQILLADFKIKLVDDFLYVDDAMSMANSLEGRHPFLDRKLVEFAFSIPNRYKFHNGEGKYVLKKAMKKILPERVLSKIKQGFGGNVGIQFSGEIAEYAKQMLPEGYAVNQKYVSKKYITDVLNRQTSMSLVKHYTVLWNLLAFEVWYRIFILSDKVQQPKTNDLML
jgi:asparagine synthase (glutamine-hydrolysing)